jgi:hypothetical protein
VEFFNGAGMGKAADVAIAGTVAGYAVLTGVNALADLVKRPDVTAWLSKVTPKDTAVWEKLPPDQKALFSDDMAKLFQAAKSKGIHVSPALTAFVVGTVASQSKDDPKGLKKQYDDLQNSFHKAGMAQQPAQPQAPPGPQSSVKVTHRFNSQTGQIEAA